MLRKCIAISMLLITNMILAATFPLPADGGSVIGKIKTVIVKKDDTFSKIARENSLGYYQLVEVNPGVDPDNPQPGTVLILPERYVLPNVAHQGMVINLAELRLYYYPPDKKEVITFPVGVAKEGWLTTPLGKLTVIEHKKDPPWFVPESIRKHRLEVDGTVLPEVVPPGPDNPLGKYMMRLSRPTYLIHGTNLPEGIGRRSTSGCISLYPEDIEQLYHLVSNGTPVYIINEPYKLGWEKEKVYLESHVPLTNTKDELDAERIKPLLALIDQYTEHQEADINWKKVTAIGQEEQGLPQEVGYLLASGEG